MNVDSLIFLANCPSLLFGSYYDWWGGLYGYCADEWVRDPSGVLCICHQSLARNIKESTFIRVNNPTLDRNIVNLTYPTYGIGSLLNTPGL